MAQKLNQLDGFIAQTLPLIDEDTVFIVMGDHGMTEDGNHGGGTEDETDSTLFIYSPSLRVANHSMGSVVHQTDLPATLSLLLDTPIPFENLGRLVMPLFQGTDPSAQVHGLVDLYLNCHQVLTFLQTYAELSGQNNLKLDTVAAQLQDIQQNQRSELNNTHVLEQL